MGKQRAMLYRLDWDSCFYADMQMGIGFQIDEPVAINLDGSKDRTLYGAASPLYGTTYGDENDCIGRYRCLCGRLKGRQYEGEVCPFCKKPVEAKETNINICGYITIHGEETYLIQPLYFRILAQAIGKTFSEIIYAKYKVDTDGIRKRVDPEDLDIVPDHPFYGIGMREFYLRYEEILTYYMNLSSKKNKRKTFEMLLANKKSVFCQHIPIYSTLLRPQSITQDTFYYQGADKIINPMFSLSENLKRCDPNDIEWGYYMMRLQIKVNKLWDYDFETMNGKAGIIRDMLMGGSLNYTARNVIIPCPSLKDNEIDISYHTFRELFKPKIISYLQMYEDMTLSEAELLWEESFLFNEKVYSVMNLIVQQDNIGILINRNPTLNYYSMLLMKIRRIKRSGTDYCLSVPLSILTGLNADFDGDILNIIAILNESIKRMFRKYDPITRMIIARDTGLLNTYFSVSKSQKIDLYQFATMGAMENDMPETYPEEELVQQEWEKEIRLRKSLRLKLYMKPEDMEVIKDYDAYDVSLIPKRAKKPKETKESMALTS